MATTTVSGSLASIVAGTANFFSTIKQFNTPTAAVILTSFVFASFEISHAAAATLEEVVVTARKRTESLSDVAGSIYAYTEQDLRAANIERAEDFINLTPGVVMMSAAVEAGDTQINIRGISSVRDATSSFAYVIDGILHPNPWGFNREYAGLEQIEVLKGPQGALYGRNAAAGAIVVTTRKPGDELHGYIKAKAGDSNSQFVAGSIGGPIIKGQLAGMLSADYRHTDGFYTNAFNGSDTVDNAESYDFSGRLVWTPNDDFELDTKVHLSKFDGASILTNVAFQLPGFVPFIGPDAWEDVNGHDYVFESNLVPENEQELFEISAKLDYELHWAHLTAWVLHSNMDQFLFADGTSGANGLYFAHPECIASTARVNATGYQTISPTFVGATPGTSVFGPYSPTTCDGYQYQERDQKDTSFEIRLTSSDDQRLRWMAGFYYLDEERRVGVGQYLDDGRPELPKFMINELADSVVYDRFDTEAWAVFGSVAYDVWTNFEVEAAVRYDSEDREATSLVPPAARSLFIQIDPNSPGFFGGYPLNAAFVNFDAAGNVTGFKSSLDPREQSFKQAQPKVSLRWDINDEWTAFASYGLGFKSGGFNSIGVAEIVDVFFNRAVGAGLTIGDDFDKEISNAFEVGFKARLLDDRLSLEGAVYHTLIDDMQFFEFLVGDFGLLRVVTSIDEVETTGAELSSKFQATDYFSVYGSVSIIDGEIKKNRNRPISEGNKVPSTPDYTLNLGGTLTVPVFSGIDLVGRIDYALIGPTQFHTIQDDVSVIGANYARSERDRFDLVNLRIAFESGNWTLGFVGKNLFDKVYPTEVISAPEAGGAFINPGARRSLAAEISYRF